jgi:hypothetical protein
MITIETASDMEQAKRIESLLSRLSESVGYTIKPATTFFLCDFELTITRINHDLGRLVAVFRRRINHENTLCLLADRHSGLAKLMQYKNNDPYSFPIAWSYDSLSEVIDFTPEGAYVLKPLEFRRLVDTFGIEDARAFVNSVNASEPIPNTLIESAKLIKRKVLAYFRTNDESLDHSGRLAAFAKGAGVKKNPEGNDFKEVDKYCRFFSPDTNNTIASLVYKVDSKKVYLKSDALTKEDCLQLHVDQNTYLINTAEQDGLFLVEDLIYDNKLGEILTRIYENGSEDSIWIEEV